MKKKLNLSDLKVSSFVTNINNTKIETVKGGRAPQSNDGCGADQGPKSRKWFCGGEEPNSGETVLNICETVYYDC